MIQKRTDIIIYHIFNFFNSFPKNNFQVLSTDMTPFTFLILSRSFSSCSFPETETVHSKSASPFFMILAEEWTIGILASVTMAVISYTSPTRSFATTVILDCPEERAPSAHVTSRHLAISSGFPLFMAER